MTERSVTPRQLQRLYLEGFDEGFRCAVLMLTQTAAQYDEALMPHPRLDQIADQLQALLTQRQTQRSHE